MISACWHTAAMSCGSAVMTWPGIARAQQMPVIGLLGASTAQAWAGLTGAFHQGLGDAVRDDAGCHFR